MGYGRASSDEVLEPDVILALTKRMRLPVSQEEAENLAALLMNQLAAVDSFDAFDLQDIVPAPIFRLGREDTDPPTLIINGANNDRID
ncbi:MAG: hypothetical protein OXG85_05680 [Chloroflexi bacterium]|nr:hypothetical protein [Chloroflexota bacterium]